MIKTLHKHTQLSELFRREIAEGHFPDQRFHTVKHLMERYEVSQATLTRALQPLFQEGVLYSVAGKGTFVRPGGLGEHEAKSPAATRTLYCIVSHNEIFDPAANRENWFTPYRLLQGVSARTRTRRHALHVIPMDPDIASFRALAERPSSGFVFFEYNVFEQMIEHCVRLGLAFSVFTKHHPLARNLNQVWLNVEEAQRLTVAHLAAQGRRRIAFVGDHPKSHRLRGYRAALRAAGLPRRAELCRFVPSGQVEEARKATAELLARHPDLDAVSCSNDMRALGALAAVRDAGRAAPDVAVTGIDNAWRHYPGSPAITTADLHVREAGERLAERVEAALAGEPPATVEIRPGFVKGETG